MHTRTTFLRAVVSVQGRLPSRWLGVAAAFGACLAVAAPASAAPFVYATIPAVGEVAEFDAAAGPLAPVGTVGSAADPSSIAVTPDGTSVYVANSSNDTVSQYDVAANGTLTPKTPATIRTGRAPLGIAVNPDGKSVYVVDSHDDTVSQYDIGPGGVLSPTIPATVATGGNPTAIAVSPDGKHVYITDFCCESTVSQYSVGAGDTLTPETPATVRTGTNPDGIVVAPNGKSAYVTNGADNTVSQYSIGAGGALTPETPATVASGNGPAGLAVSPDSESVYVANELDGDLAQYAVSTGGALALKTPQTIGAGTSPRRVVVSPDGQHVYVTDAFDKVIWQYSGGDGPGALTPLSPLERDRRTRRADPRTRLAIGDCDRAIAHQVQLPGLDPRLPGAGRAAPHSSPRRPRRRYRHHQVHTGPSRTDRDPRPAVGRQPARTGRTRAVRAQAHWAREDQMEPDRKRAQADAGALPDHTAHVRSPRTADRARPPGHDHGSLRQGRFSRGARPRTFRARARSPLDRR